MRVSWFRGFYSQQAAESDRRGGMLATGISAQDAQKYLDELPPRSVVVACVNSPASTTLSGDVDKIDQLEKTLQKDGIFARKLRVDTAYHSPHMEALVDVVSNAIECIKPEDRFGGSIPMLSSVTKQRVCSAELGGSYWVQNMISAVEFTSAVSQLASLGESIKGRRRPVPIKWTALVEIGPHAVLKGPVTQILQSVSPGMVSLPYHSLVARNQNALRTSFEVVGSLWSTGHGVDLAEVNHCVDPQPSKMVADLPSYTWNHQTSFWHEPLESAQLRQRKFPRHDILGAPLDYQNALEPRWRNFLRLSENPWMADHVVAGSIVFPAAGMMVMAIEAARQIADGKVGLKGIEFQDLHFLRGVVIPEDERGLETVLQVSPHPGMPGWYQFGIFSLPSGGAWTQHAKGAFTPRYENHHDDDEHIANWDTLVSRIQNTQSIAQKADIGQAYQWLSQTGGLTVGPCFKTITDVSFCESEPRVWLSGVVTDTKQGMPHERETPSFIHPTTLDCLFQSALFSCSEALASSNANIPVGVDHAYISERLQPQPGDNFVVHTESQWRDGKSRSQCIASDPSLSKPWITFDGVHLGRLPFSPNTSQAEEATSQSRYSSIVWNEHLKSPLPVGRVSDGVTQNEAAKISGLHLRDWVERLCHTHGDAKLLLATSGPSSYLIENLQDLSPASGNRPCLGKVATVLCGAKYEGEENTPAGAHVASLVSLDQISSSSLSEETYDLVVIDDISVWETENTQSVLSFLDASLGQGGFAALRVSDEYVDSAVEVLQRFGGLEPHSLTQDRNFIIAGQKSVPWTPPSEVYILGANKKGNSSLVVNHLEKEFTSQNTKLVLVDLDQAADLVGKTVISLLDLAGPWVSDWSAADLQHLQELIQAQYVLWVSPFWAQGTVENAGYGAAAGLLRTLRNEQWSTTIPQILVDEKDMQDEINLARGIVEVMQLTTQDTPRRPDLEYRWASGKLLVGRVLETPTVDEAMHTLVHGPRPVLGDLILDSRPLTLNTKDASNTFWEEQNAAKDPLTSGHVELKVELATIFDGEAANSLEVGLPMFEVVGTVQHTEADHLSIGDKVLTLVSGDCGLSTTIRVPQSDAIKIPTNVDSAQIISAPLAYLHAWRILVQVGGLRSTSSALLVGSISQSFRAMIDFALGLKIHVIIATDSQMTADILLSRYPALKDRILGIHGGLEASVSRLTNGCGVEATISSLGGYSGRVAAKCLTEGGHYINLSSDMKLSALPESFIDSGCTFSSPQLRKTFSEKPGNLHASTRQVINFMEQNNMLERVEVHPTFPISDVQAAFKHCKENNTRAIVDLQAPGRVPILLPPPELTRLSAENTYILAGGLGNLGMAFASTLVDSGARHLIFLGRSSVVHPVSQVALDRFRDLACRIDVVRCDISKKEDIEHLASEIRSQQWNVAGIMQCATVLRVSSTVLLFLRRLTWFAGCHV